MAPKQHRVLHETPCKGWDGTFVDPVKTYDGTVGQGKEWAEEIAAAYYSTDGGDWDLIGERIILERNSQFN
jgi:hypothetical protein